MSQVNYLSYFLSENTPLYGNSKGISIEKDKNIDKGDSCNTLNLSFPNHSSTHIDLPCHFNQSGKSLNDYEANFWDFNNVLLIDISSKVKDLQLIRPLMFPNKINKKVELLLIKTSYQQYRGTDRYTLTPPGLSPELANYFRKMYPSLRCIGMDLISVSSYGNREAGRRAHHEFLNPKHGDPILLIEDMKLDIDNPIKRVIVAPLLVDNADGVPCTVISFS